MKASPAGRTLVCPLISPFAVSDFSWTHTSKPQNTASVTDNNYSYMKSPYGDYSLLDNSAAVTWAGTPHRRWIAQACGIKGVPQVFGVVELVYPGMA
ncbi:hypothetical protein [Ulvibacterium sp.]|uniref:hypothetical protein n=1 Tax=Ulvibacterium sp. TaxID=2665914 RepID=UPI0026338308|nr:hypothetical protein [Ulvibacterium sp.]